MTFVSGQRLTIEQPLSEKIQIIQNSVLLGGTGSIGLNQRFAETLERCWIEQWFQNKSVIDIGRMLSQKAQEDFSQTGVQMGQYGALVAVPCRHQAELIEFAINDFQPEVKTKDNWYVSIGSGQPVADPLLGFMRRVFWIDNPPNLQEAVFATTMVLKLGCEMAPLGVAEPIQIATLGPGKQGKLNVQRLSQDALSEHIQNVKGAIEHFRMFSEFYREFDTKVPKHPEAPSS